jgi:hypothetical protein
MTDEGRWRLLQEELALVRRDFFPAAEEWPAFADYHDEHLRLLDLRAEMTTAYGDLRRAFEQEEEQRGEALSSAFLSGGKEPKRKTTPPEAQEAQLKEGWLRVEAANDALVAFLQKALAEVRERDGELYGELQERVTAAEEKRAEAQRLLDEADLLVRGMRRQQLWLDRTMGRTALGHLPYGLTEVPPPPEELDLVDALAGGSTVEVIHA